MNLRIVGPRILVKNYALPDTIGSLIVPGSYKKMHDGKNFEVIAVGDKVKDLLCITGEVEDEEGLRQTVGLAEDVAGLGCPPLVLEPDDIIQLKGMFKGAYSPEMSAFYGFDCWFVDVIETKHERPTCAIKTVWPSRVWKTDSDTEAA